MKKIWGSLVTMLLFIPLLSQSITNVKPQPLRSAYSPGETISLFWNPHGISSNSLVKITLWREGTSHSICLIKSDVPANSMIISWKVPSSCINPHNGKKENLYVGKLKFRVRLQGHKPPVFGESQWFSIIKEPINLPDLKVLKVWVTPSNPRIGDKIKLHCKIMNNGGDLKGYGKNMPSWFTQFFFNCSSLSIGIPGRNMPSGKVKVLSVEYNHIYPPGAQTICTFECVVDAGAMVREKNEENNSLKYFFELRPAQGKIALMADNGRYVCADKGLNGKMVADRTTVREWEIFDLIPLGGNKYALKASYGKYVSADLGLNGKLYANRDRIGPWETFELISLGRNKYALKASNGKYVCADHNKKDILVADRDSIQQWETFTIIWK